MRLRPYLTLAASWTVTVLFIVISYHLRFGRPMANRVGFAVFAASVPALATLLAFRALSCKTTVARVAVAYFATELLLQYGWAIVHG